MLRIILGLGGLVVVLLVVGGLALYTAPVGTGEYRTSPDQQFCARATTFYQRRVFASPRQYQRYEITTGACEQQAGRMIWWAEYEPTGAKLLDYGMRGERFVTWAPTNDQVTFILDEQRTLTIPVP